MSQVTNPTTDLASEEVQDLLRKAIAGDEQTVPELRRILKDNPSLWQEGGDLALQARRSWMQNIAGKNLLFWESLELQLEAMKAELTRASDSPLEKLLIEQITLTWLEAYWASSCDAQNVEKSLNQTQQDMLQKRVDRAHRRLQASIKKLATVRKLVTPPLSPFDLAMNPPTETSRPEKEKGHRPHPRMNPVPVHN